ncbi:uncharacterized protein [Panulirus ornatus]|uniref:uncharacterized protein isoform X1 n=1 Tax=Panulirus ornatus TaxID=150431 RepID=UPI003A853298
MNLEALKEKDWKIQQQKPSGQRTNMVLNLQDIQSIFYILVWAACVAGNNQALLEVLRGGDGVTEGEGLEAAATRVVGASDQDVPHPPGPPVYLLHPRVGRQRHREEPGLY